MKRSIISTSNSIVSKTLPTSEQGEQTIPSEFEFSLQSVARAVSIHRMGYTARTIRTIALEIERNAIAGNDCFWHKFVWADGDYSDVLSFFEERGVTFGCPTGPDNVEETSFLVSWDLEAATGEQQ